MHTSATAPPNVTVHIMLIGGSITHVRTTIAIGAGGDGLAGQPASRFEHAASHGTSATRHFFPAAPSSAAETAALVARTVAVRQ